MNNLLMIDIKSLQLQAKSELKSNILPYWINRMVDIQHGGFYGRRDGDDTLIPQAAKGCILNARILWTFSHASRLFAGEPESKEYLQMASSAFAYLQHYFEDKTSGGVYWSVDHRGEVIHTKKQIYAQAFAVYAYAEYYMATGDKIALHKAIDLYQLIEVHAWDNRHEGYFEAYDQQWQVITDVRLSSKDFNEPKTMNTHLHLLEAYTNLYRCWQSAGLKQSILKLLALFHHKIIQHNFHVGLFFDRHWNEKSGKVSYGHTIEASWLLQEAAEVIEDSHWIQLTKAEGLKMVHAVALDGLYPEGPLYNERMADGTYDRHIHWWPQAEALVAYVNCWQNTGDNSFLEKAKTLLDFIQKYCVDHQYGEWHWVLDASFCPNRSEDKAGFWKCPYHNGRACMEIIKRLSKAKKNPETIG